MPSCHRNYHCPPSLKKTTSNEAARQPVPFGSQWRSTPCLPSAFWSQMGLAHCWLHSALTRTKGGRVISITHPQAEWSRHPLPALFSFKEWRGNRWTFHHLPPHPSWKLNGDGSNCRLRCSWRANSRELLLISPNRLPFLKSTWTRSRLAPFGFKKWRVGLCHPLSHHVESAATAALVWLSGEEGGRAARPKAEQSQQRASSALKNSLLYSY